MTADKPAAAAELKVDASTCRTSAGADWFPRRSINTGVVHWFYAPRLKPGITAAAACSDTFAGIWAQDELSKDLTGGIPCERCHAKWSMT